MSQTKRNYKATIILDNRGKEDSVEQIIESVKKEIVAVQGEVTAVENLGRREFVKRTINFLAAFMSKLISRPLQRRRPNCTSACG